MNGRAISVFSASPTATGVRATIVPTLVPMDREMKQAAINIPANSRLSGRICRVRLTVASIAPICLALFAKETARMNILNGSSYGELVNPLVQFQAARDSNRVAGRNKKSDSDRYLVEVVDENGSYQIEAEEHEQRT